MGDDRRATVVGVWTVRSGTVVTADGAHRVTVIHDGDQEFHSAQNPTHLMIALAHHLGVDKIELGA